MRFRQLAALAAFAVSFPAVSHAQLGGLVRKAKDAAANKVETKVVENKNLKPSNAFGPELTTESLDGVLRGLAAAEAKLDDADRLRTERQKIDAESYRSAEAHEKDRHAYEDLRHKTESCQDKVIDTRRTESQDAYMARMKADPAAQAKMVQATMAVSQKMSAAQAKGDTAEARKLMIELVKAQGIDPKADSAVAVKSCGAVPAKPAWLSEQEAMRERSRALDGQLREVESGAHAAGAKASGMSFKEYSLARERVLHWSLEARGATPIQAFGNDERKLLQDRKSDIQRFKRALEGGA